MIMSKLYTYEELDALIGHTVALIDTNHKKWIGKLEDLTSDLDNETDEKEGEMSVGIYQNGKHYEFYQSEILSVMALEE